MERKIITGAAFKRAEGCEFSAVIATLGVVDSDGDVILPGAFAGADSVPVLPAHDSGHAPIGKARVVERGSEAIAEGVFNTEIQAGQDWCAALRFDAASPPAVQEWSFAFLVPEDGALRETRDGRSVRVIRAMNVLEVSPVLRGAGVNTRTTCAGDCHGKGAKSCGCGGACCEAEREAQWTAEVLRRKWLATLYPHAPYPEQLHEDLAEMEADDARRAIAKATQAARQWQERYPFAEADRAAREQGRERVKYSRVPAWLEGVSRTVANDLDLLSARVRLFRECRPTERHDDTLDAGAWGIARPYYREVFLRDGLSRFETVATLGHELYHLWEHHNGREDGEAEAERYGLEVARYFEAAA